MASSKEGDNRISAELEEPAQGQVRLHLRGRLDVYSTGQCWRDLETRLRRRQIKSLQVDASQLELYGGIGLALLQFLAQGGMTPGAEVKLEGLNEGAQKLLDKVTAADFKEHQQRKPERPTSWPEEIGSVTRGLMRDLREQVEFIGALSRALPSALVHPKRMRWGEIMRVVERAGANALPVVALFSWLVGLVIALEAARPLEQLGAQIFIADMIGFASIRDMGPMVTAIMLAGRSSSAFAAEIGTMKVNQELDALKTMGIEPVRFLVLQRVLGALVLTPLLTLYAMAMSVIGGVTVMRFMGFPPRMIYHQMLGRVGFSDLGVGLTKSVIFGLIVGAVGCLRGLQTEEGPEAVGTSTTRAVVACIILIILANTIYSTINYFLWSDT